MGSLQKLETRLARLLRHATGNHHHSRSGKVLVIARAHGKRMRERDGVIDVIRFGLCALAVQIHQHDLTAHAAHHESVRGGRADHATANDSDFHRSKQIEQEETEIAEGGKTVRDRWTGIVFDAGPIVATILFLLRGSMAGFKVSH